MSSLDQLKIRLKTWEHEFQDKNSRPPTKEDIKWLPEIKEMYKQYQVLKKQNASIHEIPKVLVTPSKTDTFPTKIEMSKNCHTSNIELGPTPQIYGKTLSIFEMKLSPVKKALNFESPMDMTQEDNSAQLENVIKTPDSSPFKRPKQPIQSNYYGPNSPLKLEEANITLNIKSGSPLGRMTEANMDLDGGFISCNSSPLVRRPLTKSLLELAKEHEKFLQEFKKNGDQSNLFSQETKNDYSEGQLGENEKSQTEGKENKKKRRKVLRRLVTTEESKVIPKDISKELMKLKQQQLNGFLNREAVEETENEEQDKFGHMEKVDKETKVLVPQPTPRRRTRKYNLVSNNFRRLKLPKSHSNKRRWRR